MLAPVAPDFISEGVLSSHAEGITLLVGDFVTRLVQVQALRQGQGLGYCFRTSCKRSFHLSALRVWDARLHRDGTRPHSPCDATPLSLHSSAGRTYMAGSTFGEFPTRTHCSSPW